jgi:hypothetical protein
MPGWNRPKWLEIWALYFGVRGNTWERLLCYDRGRMFGEHWETGLIYLSVQETLRYWNTVARYTWRKQICFSRHVCSHESKTCIIILPTCKCVLNHTNKRKCQQNPVPDHTVHNHESEIRYSIGLHAFMTLDVGLHVCEADGRHIRDIARRQAEHSTILKMTLRQNKIFWLHVYALINRDIIRSAKLFLSPNVIYIEPIWSCRTRIELKTHMRKNLDDLCPEINKLSQADYWAE